MINEKKYKEQRAKINPTLSLIYIHRLYRILTNALTSILSKTSVTPNMVSFSGTVIAGIGSAILVFANTNHSWASIPFLLYSQLAGGVDGSLARKRGIFSPFGSWINIISERTGDTIIGTSFAWYTYKVTGSANILILAVIILVLHEGIATLRLITAGKIPPEYRNLLYSKKLIHGENKIMNFLIKTFAFTSATYVTLICFGIIFRAPLLLLIFMLTCALATYSAGLIKIGRSVHKIKLPK